MRLTRNRRSSSIRLAVAWSVATEGTVGLPSWPFTWGGEIVTVGWAGADPPVRKRKDAHADSKIRRAAIASPRLANLGFASRGDAIAARRILLSACASFLFLTGGSA